MDNRTRYYWTIYSFRCARTIVEFISRSNSCLHGVDSMKTKLILLFVAITILSGCDTATPKCNSDDARDLVISIAQEKIDKRLSLTGDLSRSGDIKPSVINVRTTGHDTKLDIYQCSADFELSSTNKGAIPINYEIQKTDDDDGHFYINVYGLNQPLYILINKVMLN